MGVLRKKEQKAYVPKDVTKCSTPGCGRPAKHLLMTEHEGGAMGMLHVCPKCAQGIRGLAR